uniref:Uncharacterized protein n=1 Tax=Proboscia inermis TaxID=420281 RepID=A0A7S0CIA4_9STRA|mmetsp:Transcript_50160/g.50516  ORF Transcript_50160/g.50516 Transcript_50160/m.50516 type:complete len:138 (+) Transcript_50160:187-600(+)
MFNNNRYSCSTLFLFFGSVIVLLTSSLSSQGNVVTAFASTLNQESNQQRRLQIPTTPSASMRPEKSEPSSPAGFTFFSGRTNPLFQDENNIHKDRICYCCVQRRKGPGETMSSSSTLPMPPARSGMVGSMKNRNLML